MILLVKYYQFVEMKIVYQNVTKLFYKTIKIDNFELKYLFDLYQLKYTDYTLVDKCYFKSDTKLKQLLLTNANGICHFIEHYEGFVM